MQSDFRINEVGPLQQSAPIALRAAAGIRGAGVRRCGLPANGMDMNFAAIGARIPLEKTHVT